MLLQDKIQQHRQLVAQLRVLQESFDTERTAALAALPAYYGFPDVNSFLRALKKAHEGKLPDVNRPKRGRPRREGNSHSVATVTSTPVSQAHSAPKPADGISPKGSNPTVQTPAAKPVQSTPISAASVKQPDNRPANTVSLSSPPLAAAAPGMAAASANAIPAKSASLPTGTSLDDPANFGLLPQMDLLEQTEQNSAGYRARLSTALAYANKVLHTSRVPAAVWREWRQFERRATEILRAGQGVF